MTEFTLIVLAAIVANLLTPTIRYLWRCVARYVRRHYIWIGSTQRLIDNRPHWRKTGNLRKHTHRFIEGIASILDTEFIAWKKDIEKNNTKLYRQSGLSPRWQRHSQANIEDCFVNPSYNQFLELMMDEDTAKFFAENKPVGKAFEKWKEGDGREFDEYKREYDKHIKFIDNQERYESVLHWGFRSKNSPYIAAKVYEEKTLPFPEDYHLHVEGFRSFDFGHIYRFINKQRVS